MGIRVADDCMDCMDGESETAAQRARRTPACMHREVCDGSALSSPNISPYANLSLTSRIHPGVERPLNLAWRPYGPKAKGEESRRPNEIENQNRPTCGGWTSAIQHPTFGAVSRSTVLAHHASPSGIKPYLTSPGKLVKRISLWIMFRSSGSSVLRLPSRWLFLVDAGTKTPRT